MIKEETAVEFFERMLGQRYTNQWKCASQHGEETPQKYVVTPDGVRAIPAYSTFF